VAIARGLVHRPELVLADEPTAALDEESGRTVVELLRKRADEDGVTILMVTHDNRILDIADRIVNMVDGRIRSDVRVGEAQRISEILQNCPVFRDITPRTLVEVADQMEVVAHRAGERIIRQGDEGDAFYLVREGTVGIRREPGNHLIAEVGTGGYFGETALLTGMPRNASVDAITDVTLFKLAKSDFDHAMASRATLATEVRDTLFSR
jgi:putative ABC transport system ATP-binding protein